MTPGFIDAHIHMIAGGFRLGWVALGRAHDRDTFATLLAAFAAGRPRDEWILGGDWDHERWGGAWPTREWIDAVAPDHPIWLTRVDSHMALANSRALQLAGVTRDTPDVEGGAIVRDAQGEPTGLLKDRAMMLVERAVPPPTVAQEDAALDAAMRHVAAQGVTSVHHMGALPPEGSWNDLAVFRRVHARGGLRTRIYATVPLDTWPRLDDLIRSGEAGGPDGRGDGWLRVGALKSFIDGSLGARTAAFHEPYTDAPDERGLFVADEADLRRWMIDADRSGLQLITHAIGDRANTRLLDLYARRRRGQRRARSPAAGRARAAPPRRGCPALRRARRDRQHAAVSRHRRRPLGRARVGAGPRLTKLRVADAARPRHTARVRQRLVRRPANAARRVVCRGDPAHARRAPSRRMGARRAHQPRRRTPRLHRGRRLRGIRRSAHGTDRARVRGGLAVLDRDLFSGPPESIADAQVAATIVAGEIVYERD